ncbi:MAG: DUF4124 domain-containing protein [Pseudomonadota bacterium]
MAASPVLRFIRFPLTQAQSSRSVTPFGDSSALPVSDERLWLVVLQPRYCGSIPSRARFLAVFPMTFLVLGLCLPLLVLAQTVYKSIDDGVTTYSDVPPTAGPVEVLELNLPPDPNTSLLEDRLTAMRASTNRLAQSRLAREQQRSNARQRRLDARYQDQRAIGWQPADPVTFASQPFLPYRPRLPYRSFGPPYAKVPVPTGPGYGTRTRNPASPHTHPPGWSVLKPGNQQLMRPIVSRRD